MYSGGAQEVLYSSSDRQDGNWISFSWDPVDVESNKIFYFWMAPDLKILIQNCKVILSSFRLSSSLGPGPGPGPGQSLELENMEQLPNNILYR